MFDRLIVDERSFEALIGGEDPEETWVRGGVTHGIRDALTEYVQCTKALESEGLVVTSFDAEERRVLFGGSAVYGT